MGKKDHTPLTAEQVRELFNYDPETGIVSWREDSPVGRKGPRHVAGDPFGTLNYVGTNKRPVLCGPVCGQAVLVHRMVWLMVTGNWPKHHVDHWDGNSINNRWKNLRDVTHIVNMQNQRGPHRDRKYDLPIGVSYHKSFPSKPYAAKIVVYKKVHRLGNFKTPEEAAACYVAAKRLMHEGCTI